MSGPKKLTDKQRAFIAEYLIDKNATQAAIRAGYSENGAEVQGHRLLRNVNIKAEIDRRLEKVMDKLEITQERWLQEVARLAFVDPAGFFDENGNLKPIHEMDEDTRRAIGGVKVRLERTGEYDDDGKPIMAEVVDIKQIDKTKGLEMLGKNLGCLRDNVHLSGKLGIEELVAAANSDDEED